MLSVASRGALHVEHHLRFFITVFSGFNHGFLDINTSLADDHELVHAQIGAVCLQLVDALKRQWIVPLIECIAGGLSQLL